MGLDLTVAPASYNKDWWLCYNRLKFDRDYDLFANFILMPNIGNNPIIPTFIVPHGKKIDWYGDSGVSVIQKDAYGEYLKYCNSQDLKSIGAFNTTKWNAAVIDLLCSIESCPVILYWH